MAIISTVVGIVLSVPIGFGAARNLAPHWVNYGCCSIVAGSRSFPEIILAIFAVKLFRFGPFAGFIALSIGGIGLQLNCSTNTLAWTQVSMILLVILCTVIVSEWVSAEVRHAII